jgi:quercetin dioxygenase-like cupin family protein
VLPGQTNPEHYHERKLETFHILHGSVEVTLDGEARVLQSGDVLTIERGARHAFGSRTGAVIEEISTTHIGSDSYYTDPNIPATGDRKTYVTHWMG